MLTISTVSTGVGSDFPVRKGFVDTESSLIRSVGTAAVKKLMVVVAGRIYRECIEKLLQGEDRKIVGKCETPSQIQSSIDPSDVPDLFVVSLGDGETYSNIISVIRDIRPRVPRARWILLCRRTDDVFLKDAVSAGVDGLLFEDSTGELLQHVVDLVLHGYHCAPAALPPASFEQNNIKPLQRMSTSADIKMRPFVGNGASSDIRPLDRDIVCDAEAAIGMGMRPQASQAEQKMRQSVSLSEREKEIMHCLMGGHSNKLIARQLHISEATVKVHVKALLRKMQVANRTQAAICALNLVRQSEHVDRVEDAGQVSLGERASSAMSMATC